MSEKWTARHGRIQDPHGCTRVVECRGAGLVDGDETARDIVARLNGPSPAEVGVMLRSVEWSSLDGAAEGSYGHNRCPSCQGFEPDHELDCKLAAMIKRCDEA